MTMALAQREPDDDGMSISQAFAKSGFFKDIRDAAQAIVKIQAGGELDFGPFASMQGVHVIQGKLVLSAGLMAARIKSFASGKYNYRVKQLTDAGCAIEFFEKGQSVGVSSFSADDARAAGLLDKQTWKQYRRNMLFSRALSNGARWYCPDAFSGAAYTAEEMGADIDVETGEVTADPPTLPEPDEQPSPPADEPPMFHEQFVAEMSCVKDANGLPVYSPVDITDCVRAAIEKHGDGFLDDDGQNYRRLLKSAREKPASFKLRLEAARKAWDSQKPGKPLTVPAAETELQIEAMENSQKKYIAWLEQMEMAAQDGNLGPVVEMKVVSRVINAELVRKGVKGREWELPQASRDAMLDALKTRTGHFRV